MKLLSGTLKETLLLTTLVSMSACGTAFAIDLGEMQVHSAPGEPLNALIPVIDVDTPSADIEVGLADEDEFNRAVVAITPEVDILEFVKVKTSDGKVRIRVKTKVPIDEEVLHFLIAVRTPDARVVREYVVIQENDVYATHAQPTIIELISAEPEIKLPLPYIAVSKTRMSAEFADDEDEVENQQNSVLVAEQKPVRTAAVINQAQYRVKPGDNLSYIAQKVQRNIPNASFNQVLAALYQLNPDAFIHGNVNLIRSGVTLKVPNATLLAELDLTSTTEQIRAQMAAYSKKQPITSAAATSEEATPAPVATSVPSNVQAKPAELKILTPESTTQNKMLPAVTGTMTDEQISENLALMNEELSQVQTNNESVLTRIQALQTQISTLQELLKTRQNQHQLITGTASGNTAEQLNPNFNENLTGAPATPEVTPAPISSSISPGLGELAGAETVASASNLAAIPSIPKTMAESQVQPQVEEKPVTSENVQPSTEPQTPESKAPEATVPVVPALEKPVSAQNQVSFWQKLSQHQWLNYLILAILVLGAALAYLFFSRRKTLGQELTEEQQVTPLETQEPMMAYQEHPVDSSVSQEEHQVTEAQMTQDEGDKVGAKLELAKAYFDLGDSDGAIALLQEVLWEGNAEQRRAAQEWLDKIDAEKKA